VAACTEVSSNSSRREMW